MKNSVSDGCFHVDGDEDGMEENRKDNDSEYEDESDSSSSSLDDSPQQHRLSSYNSLWPQSYRQSIDMYGSVASPNIGFLGTPTLSHLSSSFFSSSLTRRRTPEVLSSLVKPFLTSTSDEQKPDQEISSSHFLPPTPPKKSTSVKALLEKSSKKAKHELPVPQQSSYWQAVINGINVLCGVGILSTPYAAKEGGWLGILVLLMFAVLSFYTGILLQCCLDSESGMKTYPDIGQAAFGHVGRVAISIILYMELYACCVDYIILESDNLSSLFPNVYISFGGVQLRSQNVFAIMTALVVLPTVWLRDMSLLSYISAGGVVASILTVLCLFWVGLVDQVGFQGRGTTINFSSLPVAIGLYGYCYSGHAVFPNIYTSMKNRSQFPAVLLTCFAVCTVMYLGAALMGYAVFGEMVESQFTLNMPPNLTASRIAIWTTVVNPFTKYALTLSPVAMSLEELLPCDPLKSHMFTILIRTGLVLSTLVVGLAVPFFGLVLALIGSFLTMVVSLIFPCCCFLRILKDRATKFQVAFCTMIIFVGIASSVVGTSSAVLRIIESLD